MDYLLTDRLVSGLYNLAGRGLCSSLVTDVNLRARVQLKLSARLAPECGSQADRPLTSLHTSKVR